MVKDLIPIAIIGMRRNNIFVTNFSRTLHHFRIIREEINEDSAKLIFTDLPEGKYDVNVLLDENNNGKIDKGLILPEEGIGFSNYESIGLRNKPSFEKASFYLSADKSITVKIIYM